MPFEGFIREPKPSKTERGPTLGPRGRVQGEEVDGVDVRFGIGPGAARGLLLVAEFRSPPQKSVHFQFCRGRKYPKKDKVDSLRY